MCYTEASGKGEKKDLGILSAKNANCAKTGQYPLFYLCNFYTKI